MKGSNALIAEVLLVGMVVAVALFAYPSISNFFGTTSGAQSSLNAYRNLTKNYILLTSATAEASAVPPEIYGVYYIVRVKATIVNTSVNKLELRDVSAEIYKGGTLVFSRENVPIPAGCLNPLPAGAECTFNFEVLSPEYTSIGDIRKSHIVLVINGARKYKKLRFVGVSSGENVPYSECNSPGNFSSLPPGSIGVIDINEQVDGNAVVISGAQDVNIYCHSKLLGSGTGIGILIENSSNVSINGCEVENFEYGIYVSNSQNLSFNGVNLHDNNVDLAFDPDSLADVCTVEYADISTTSGSVRVVANGQSISSFSNISALWLLGVSGTNFDGNGVTFSHVSPAIALCNTSSVSVGSFNVEDTDVGISLIGDSGTHLDNVTVWSNMYGVYSKLSSDGNIENSIFYSGVGDVFDTSDIEWGSQTIFEG